MTVKQEINRLLENAQQLHSRHVKDEFLNSEWRKVIRNINGPSKTRANFRAKHLVERLRDSWQHLLRDRATRSLTYNDEQFHALEKIKITETGKRIKALLIENVRPETYKKAEALADWYTMAQTIHLKTEILQKDAQTYEESIFDIRDRLGQLREEIKADGKESGASSVETSLNMGPRVDVNNVRILMNYQRDIMALIRQNAEIVETIQRLGLDDEEFVSLQDQTRL